MKRIQDRFPEWDPERSPFLADLNEFGEVTVKLKRLGGRKRVLFNTDGTVNEEVPGTITNSLGHQAEEIAEENESAISRIDNELEELGDDRPSVAATRKVLTERREALERENEAIQDRMILRDRVKAIFKKYGLSAFAVAAAVGTVIGVIVSNLKSGLSSVAKGVGNGLKEIGKKLGEILPGMVGAIASFIFRTAGEVVGFLAKNTWLLIVGAVIFAIEQFKKK